MFEFKSIETDDIIPAVKRGFDILADENKVEIDVPDEVCGLIASGCGGDVRKALNSVENCYLATRLADGKRLSHPKRRVSLRKNQPCDMTETATSITILFRLIKKYARFRP